METIRVNGGSVDGERGRRFRERGVGADDASEEDGLDTSEEKGIGSDRK
jgi:hypothetical protein